MIIISGRRVTVGSEGDLLCKIGSPEARVQIFAGRLGENPGKPSGAQNRVLELSTTRSDSRSRHYHHRLRNPINARGDSPAMTSPLNIDPVSSVHPIGVPELEMCEESVGK